MYLFPEQDDLFPMKNTTFLLGLDARNLRDIINYSIANHRKLSPRIWGTK